MPFLPEMQALYDDFVRTSRQSGFQAGHEAGFQDGHKAGERAVLHRQLARRFGDLPQDARQRLEEATSSQLERWSDRVLHATALADVFG